MKNSLNTQRLSLRRIASRKRVAPSSVLSWVEGGCPRNADKTFDESAVDAWLAKHRESAAESKSLKEQKLQAEITRIQRDIRQRDHDYEAARGEVHSKIDCAKSRTAHAAAIATRVNSMPPQFAAAFPDAPKSYSDWLYKWTEQLGIEVRDGSAFSS